MKKLLGLGLGLLAAAALVVTAMAATTTQTVTPASLSFTSWYYYDDTNDIPSTAPVPGKYEIIAGPAAMGVGSVRFQTIGLERWNMATSQFANTPLSAFTALKFNTFQQAAQPLGSTCTGAAECAVYLNFDVDFGPGVCPAVTCASAGGYQRRLVYVPAVNGVVGQNTWQEWDAISGGAALWTWSGFINNGNKWPDGNLNQYRTWNDIKVAFPNAHVNEDFGSSQLLFRAGEPYNTGFIGNLDKVTIGIGANTVVYNFDPYAVASNMDDCKNGGWQSVKRADGSVFKNQGDCVSYTQNGR